MINNFISGELPVAKHWQLFKFLLLICNTAGLLIYGLLHFIFFDFPFETVNEFIILLKLFSVASSFAAGISLLLLAIDGVEFLAKQQKLKAVPAYVKALPVAAAFVIVIFIY